MVLLMLLLLPLLLLASWWHTQVKVALLLSLNLQKSSYKKHVLHTNTGTMVVINFSTEQIFPAIDGIRCCSTLF
jgi:hypothetical protein